MPCRHTSVCFFIATPRSWSEVDTHFVGKNQSKKVCDCVLPSGGHTFENANFKLDTQKEGLVHSPLYRFVHPFC
jgi:hypothetical protein